MKKVFMLLLAAASLQTYAASDDSRTNNLFVHHTDSRTDQRLHQILAGDHRTEQNRQRDRYRHPFETLAFFGIRDTQTVVEIFPGGGWYTDILAPLLKPHGKLIEANYADSGTTASAYQKKASVDFKNKLAANPTLFDAVTVTTLQPPEQTEIAPPASVDLILTFRNVHNWLNEGTADANFASFYKALKPGGVLGLEEHRAAPGTTLEQTIATGYVTESEVIRLAEKAGFKLAAKSEINANSADSKNYPNGVWTLPPTLRGVSDADRVRYQQIGESDRMTLKFVKLQ